MSAVSTVVVEAAVIARVALTTLPSPSDPACMGRGLP